MTPEELEAIAQRKTTCHPFGETVSLSRAERDALVQWTRRAMWTLTDNDHNIDLVAPYIGGDRIGIVDDYLKGE
jgi:hypothetical protein